MLKGLEMIPNVAMKRMADRMIFGMQTHSAQGYRHEGNANTYREKAKRHWNQYVSGQTDEDHLAAVMCNIAFLMFHESHQPNQ